MQFYEAGIKTKTKENTGLHCKTADFHNKTLE